MVSINIVLWGFKLLPTIVFCTSANDACSCKGGGFEVYAAFCNVTSTGAVDEGNRTLSPSNDTTAATNLLALVRAKEEYPGIFDALAGDAVIIVVSVGSLILVIIIFNVAQIYTAYLQAGDARVEAERRVAAAIEQNLQL